MTHPKASKQLKTSIKTFVCFAIIKHQNLIPVKGNAIIKTRFIEHRSWLFFFFFFFLDFSKAQNFEENTDFFAFSILFLITG